ncbi:hypothetical protein [Marmoricola sp. URHB0036]|uniref:hypothetical protein n=1 Tax=Marmoricola sp. URHB0036 TaxID=1298863 RepID=UPI0012DD5A0E|nr:hypothetical protein [Marmoricola sp. URHB0036]
MRLDDLDYPASRSDYLRAACCHRPTDLVAPVAVDPTGRSGPTRHQAAGPRYRQTSPGLYVPSDTDSDVVEQRILEQALRIRGQGAITGWAALRWRGARYFDGTDGAGRLLPVPLVVGLGKLRPDDRVSISQAQIAPTEYARTGAISCATVQRALFDEMRWAHGVRAAVVAVEKVTAARMISVGLMRRYVQQRPAWTGVQQVRDALALAVNDSHSPQETLMRLVLVLDAGLPTPLCNVPLFDLNGRLLGIPDVFDPVAGLVGEYNGASHRALDRRRADNAREERFREVGLEYFDIVEGDLRDRPHVVHRMRQTRARALFEAPEDRRWSLTPPSWWVPDEPLDLYLERVGLAPMLVHT